MTQTSSNRTDLTQNQAQAIIEPERRRWTPDVQTAFLRALASTHSVADAARMVGVGRSSAYRLRADLRGEAFDLAWDAAFSCGMDALADAALDRALNGVEVPHFYKGELIHTSRKYDERLTVALLALREQARPSYIPQSHPASAYRPDGTRSEFESLLRRIELGLERWSDEWPPDG
ncbi:hypothetical protein EH31_05815 [Erythrobacter longus]|uniref:Uncharacterized protein n=1 Tax=Erythrobacter longus TaxID=1044 RepID=A0A074N2M8_ERYLO|nr:hypothetical protein [Erythrobacter longus]KEO92182.1 hypothetical protein EH31_05815 [Erythrobacter longus]